MEHNVLFACAVCDALQRLADSRASGKRRCARCGVVIYHARNRAPDDALALTVAASVVFLIGNAFPVITIEANGNAAGATLIGASHALYAAGMGSVAFVVLLTTVAAPAVELACLCVLLVGMRTGCTLRFRGLVLRARDRLRPWSMVEIFVLGALVAIVKLGDLAHIVLGVGLWSLVAFMVMSAAAALAFDRTALWSQRGGAT